MNDKQETVTIPQELIARDQWVVWRYDTDPRTGKPAKVPYQTNGSKVRPNDPTTFTTYDNVTAVANEWEGIAFVITSEDPYCGVDLDECIDETGSLRSWSLPIIAPLLACSYGEVSPSGTGIKFITNAEKVKGSGSKKKLGPGKQGVEVYDGVNRKTLKPGHRFWTMTGNLYQDAESIGFGSPAVEVLCRDYLLPKVSKAKEGPPPKHDHGDHGDQVVDRAIKYIAKMDPAIQGENGSDRLYAVACKLLVGFDLPRDVAFRIIRDNYNPRCVPEWSDAEINHKLDGADQEPEQRGYLRDEPLPNFGLGGGDPTSDAADGPGSDPAWLLDQRQQTHNQMASNFIRRCGVDIRYVPHWDKWLVWDGRRWKIDARAAQVTRQARVFCDSLWDSFADAGKSGADSDALKAALRTVKSMNAQNAVEAIVRLSRSDRRVLIDHTDLDADPYLINLVNGTFDLRAFELREHDRRDLITCLANVSYGETAECPEWDQTLHYALDGDQDLIDYFTQILGYCLTADTGQAILPILYGGGNNGKSTIWNTIVQLFGDYATVASDSLLLGTKDDHDTVKAQLFGKRLAIIPEPSQGARLKESRMKELTGDAFITARRMREDPWTFPRTVKFLLATNHLPKVHGTDQGVWRRIKKILFGQDFSKIEGLEVKPDFHKWLATNEGPGILNRLIEGWRLYVDHGDRFTEPESVRMQTADYRSAEDPIGEFYTECILEEEHTEVHVRRFHNAYRQWCDDNSVPERERLGSTRFKDAMVSRGVECRRLTSGPNRNRWCYIGVKVR